MTRSLRLFGLLALALPMLASSCAVPERRYQVAQEVPEPDSRTLLRRLALAVPAGVPDVATSADADRAAVAGEAPPFVADVAGPDDAARAQDCLTAAIYYEARSQGSDGERAVAQVVLNRVRDRAFPRSVCGVVYQGAGRTTGCQFSFVCDGSMNARRDERAWAAAGEVAAAALAGSVYAPVGSATHYHADYVTPWWSSSLARVVKVGAHIFYRWRGAMERALAFRQDYAGNEPDVAGAGVTAAAAPDGGVTVHYGNRPDDGDAAAGVTVHRGMAATDAPGARRSFVAGVRVHFGVDAPIGDAGSDEEAVVSDET